jgi:hypothetical protein
VPRRVEVAGITRVLPQAMQKALVYHEQHSANDAYGRGQKFTAGEPMKTETSSSFFCQNINK